LFLTENLALKIDSAASTGSHGKCMRYVNFFWPPVPAARVRKTAARPLLTSYLFYKNYPYNQDSISPSDSNIFFKPYGW